MTPDQFDSMREAKHSARRFANALGFGPDRDAFDDIFDQFIAQLVVRANSPANAVKFLGGDDYPRAVRPF